MFMYSPQDKTFTEFTQVNVLICSKFEEMNLKICIQNAI